MIHRIRLTFVVDQHPPKGQYRSAHGQVQLTVQLRVSSGGRMASWLHLISGRMDNLMEGWLRTVCSGSTPRTVQMMDLLTKRAYLNINSFVKSQVSL